MTCVSHAVKIRKPILEIMRKIVNFKLGNERKEFFLSCYERGTLKTQDIS